MRKLELERTLQRLKRVRELLATPAAWTKGAAARNGVGSPVQATSPQAVCWCLTGALNKAIRESPRPAAPEVKSMRATEAAVENLSVSIEQQEIDVALCTLFVPAQFNYSAIEFNDALGIEHADILSLLDEAIAHQQKLVDKA